MNIACIGEAMIELSLGTGNREARINFAGDTLNTAVYLKRCLKNQNDVSYVTVLGTDSFSDQILETVQAEHIITDHIVRCDERIPGLYAISTDAQGERSFTYWREQSSARLLFDEPTGSHLEQLSQFDILYYSAITLAILPKTAKERFLSYLAEFRATPGKQVAFDSNYRPKLWESTEEAQHYTTRAWQQCDIALPSLDDEMALYADADEASVIQRIRQCGVVKGALKRGEKGPVDLGSTSTNTATFNRVANVVDSTAAGDSFNGAYLASLVDGNTSSQALQAGHQCASYVIQHPGAIVDDV